MKTVKYYAEEYINCLYGSIEEHERPMYAPDVQQSKKDFEAGYSAAIEKIKEYLFNTENRPENISEGYLKQTIEFLK